MIGLAGNRTCGDCTLCCKVMAIEFLSPAAFACVGCCSTLPMFRARLGQTIQNLEHDTTRLFLDRGNRAAATLRRYLLGDIFSNVKAGIACPLVVELKHVWNCPKNPSDELPVPANYSIPSNADAEYSSIIYAKLRQSVFALRTVSTKPRPSSVPIKSNEKGSSPLFDAFSSREPYPLRWKTL